MQMRIIVQKFGGTSVADEKSKLHCVEHIKNAQNEGFDHIVVVISAMGRLGGAYSTDTLLSLLQPDCSLPRRERDMLLATGEMISACVFSNLLFQYGIANSVLTGGQAGIITDDSFGEAKIIELKPKRIKEEFEKGNVVIVAGFQGTTYDGELTTLGRGGSDTSATALGVALEAEIVEIFTDVEGIYTADPRIVEDARPISSITYYEICNLAHLGAKVIHPRAIEIAMQKNIPIRVRSTFSDSLGTLVTNMTELERPPNNITDRLITGITQSPNLTQIKVIKEKNEVSLHLNVFKAMKEYQISVDFINVYPDGVSYTIAESNTAKAMEILEELGYKYAIRENCAKVSVVGANMAGVPGVMSQIMEALSEVQIEVYQSADSHTTIWVLVRHEDMVKAVKALHKKFELHSL
jgi:aspartate kinase